MVQASKSGKVPEGKRIDVRQQMESQQWLLAQEFTWNARRNARLLQWDQDFPTPWGGLTDYFHVCLRESASVFNFNEFLNFKTNMLPFKMLENVDKY